MMLCTPHCGCCPLALWLHVCDLSAFALVFLERNILHRCVNTNPFFPHRPIEASVVLLPIYEFLFPNPTFTFVLIEELSSSTVQIGPLSCAIISLRILSLYSSILNWFSGGQLHNQPVAQCTSCFCWNNEMMDTLCHKNSPAILLSPGRLSFWHYFNSWLISKRYRLSLCHLRNGLLFAQFWIVVCYDCRQRRLQVMSYIRYRAVRFLRDRHIHRQKKFLQDSSVKINIGQSFGIPSRASIIFII